MGHLFQSVEKSIQLKINKRKFRTTPIIIFNFSIQENAQGLVNMEHNICAKTVSN